MGTSRASKNLLLEAYAQNNLSKPLPKKAVPKKDPIIPSKDPNSMGIMQNTISKTRKSGYRGGNFMR
jgi:hypothetical protein